jgi:hypothetical protein
MKKFKRFSIILSIIALVFSFIPSVSVRAAATLPTLGAAASFSILAQTEITGTATIGGDVGMNNFSSNITALLPANVGGLIYATDAVPSAPGEAVISPAVQADALAAFTTDIPGQPSTSSQGPALDGLTLTPGVYDISAGRLNGGVLTLDGPGVYIFRDSSDFISSGSIKLINGAKACEVFWRVQTLATINGSSFVGTILAGTGIHFGANVTLNGRALAVGGDVTMLTDTISGPDCNASPNAEVFYSRGPSEGTINVVKTVINDSGGVKKVADFPLFVNDTLVVSGVTNTFRAPAGMYTITETSNANYNKVFSGDCDANGNLNLIPGDNKICIITNNDIGAPIVAPVPPLIDVVKVPSPLSLPNGPGLVNYTYTLRNVGTVPVTDITMVGDTCSPIVLNSGDINNDAKLNVNETWVYKCATTLTETHTNTVVATGWANGLSATDIASANVVVGLPIVPPLIHITKIPSPFTLPVGGGMVTYTNKVTNPGTVALSNVVVSDNKCGPVTLVSGDSNADSKLDPNETWTYFCKTKLTETTMNTVVATGEANGLITRDFAIATVVVAAITPMLPNTGFTSTANNLPWNIIIFIGLFLLASITLAVAVKKNKA